MINKLEQLVPLLQARERRARRRHLEDKQSHELAVRKEEQVAAKASRLRAESVGALSEALGDAPKSALQAVAQLDQAALLAQRARQAAHALQACQRITQQALDTVRDSGLAHAREARRRELLVEASSRQERVMRQQLRSVEEQRLEEQFSLQFCAGLAQPLERQP